MECKELKLRCQEKEDNTQIYLQNVWFTSEIIIDIGCKINFFYHCIIIRYIY